MEADAAEGGSLRTVEDLHALGFTLEKAIDPSGPKDAQGNYPPLPEHKKKILYDLALRWQSVWSRDAKTPIAPSGDEPFANRFTITKEEQLARV